MPKALILTREYRVILTLWAIVKSYADARESLPLARPAISKRKQKQKIPAMKKNNLFSVREKICNLDKAIY